MTEDNDKNAVTEENSLADLNTESDKKPLLNGEIKSDEEPLDEEDSSDDGDLEVKEAEENEEALDAKSQDQKPKKKGGFQKRIDKLNVKLSALEQEREYWRQEVLRMNQKTESKVETQSDNSKRPKADDFKTVDDYQEALTDWKVDQKLLERETKDKQNVMKSEYQSRLSKHQERVNAFSDAHDDFDELIESVSNIPLSIAIQESIIDSDVSAALMYELARDPKELKRISSLSPFSAAREIGKVESRLAKASTAPAKAKTTNAPKPPTPVRAKGASSVKGFSRDMTMKEYEAWRNSNQKRQ